MPHCWSKFQHGWKCYKKSQQHFFGRDYHNKHDYLGLKRRYQSVPFMFDTLYNSLNFCVFRSDRSYLLLNPLSGAASSFLFQWTDDIMCPPPSSAVASCMAQHMVRGGTNANLFLLRFDQECWIPSLVLLVVRLVIYDFARSFLVVVSLAESSSLFWFSSKTLRIRCMFLHRSQLMGSSRRSFGAYKSRWRMWTCLSKASNQLSS